MTPDFWKNQSSWSLCLYLCIEHPQRDQLFQTLLDILILQRSNQRTRHKEDPTSLSSEGEMCQPNTTNHTLFESESRLVVSDSLRPHGRYSPWNSLGQNTAVGSFSFSRGSSQPRGCFLDPIVFSQCCLPKIPIFRFPVFAYDCTIFFFLSQPYALY